jgi:hypothetical protein
MKRIFSVLVVSTICFSFMAATCKKDDVTSPGTGPDVLLPNSGFLCTMGIDLAGHTDTLTFWFSTSGQEMTLYGKGLQRADDEINLTSNGNGTMTVNRKGSYVHNGITYKIFGIQPNPNISTSTFPNPYLYDFFNASPSAETQFIIKRIDGDKTKFTIESKAYPGNFLGAAKWKNATYPIENRLVFTGKQQVFFFMQN